MFNHTVTLYNRYALDGDYRYKRTVLEGVHWESSDGVKLGDKSISTNNNTSLVIPFTHSDYKAPKEFQALRASKGWTLQPEDIVVKGTADVSIVSIADLKDYPDVKTISAVHMVDYSSVAELNNFTVELK